MGKYELEMFFPLGAPIQAKQCGTIECPVHGGWSGYSGWGSCSKTCGGGISTSVRHCTSPSPKYNGRPCSGMHSFVYKKPGSTQLGAKKGQKLKKLTTTAIVPQKPIYSETKIRDLFKVGSSD